MPFWRRLAPPPRQQQREQADADGSAGQRTAQAASAGTPAPMSSSGGTATRRRRAEAAAATQHLAAPAPSSSSSAPGASRPNAHAWSGALATALGDTFVAQADDDDDDQLADDIVRSVVDADLDSAPAGHDDDDDDDDLANEIAMSIDADDVDDDVVSDNGAPAAGLVQGGDPMDTRRRREPPAPSVYDLNVAWYRSRQRRRRERRRQLQYRPPPAPARPMTEEDANAFQERQRAARRERCRRERIGDEERQRGGRRTESATSTSPEAFLARQRALEARRDAERQRLADDDRRRVHALMTSSTGTGGAGGPVTDGDHQYRLGMDTLQRMRQWRHEQQQAARERDRAQVDGAAARRRSSSPSIYDRDVERRRQAHRERMAALVSSVRRDIAEEAAARAPCASDPLDAVHRLMDWDARRQCRRACRTIDARADLYLACPFDHRRRPAPFHLWKAQTEHRHRHAVYEHLGRQIGAIVQQQQGPVVDTD